jgi:hypothetical protein
MGEKVNASGSAANPWTEVIESGLSAGDVMRIILAIQAGETTVSDVGGGTKTITFKGQDGATDRVIASVSGSDRISVSVLP